MLSVLDKINIAKISEYLCLNAVDKKGLYGGGVDLQLARKIYNIRKSVEWLYGYDPQDDTLEGTSNYLYALCAPFNLEATKIYNAYSGGGTIVTPTGVMSITTPIRITEADFVDATNWHGQNSYNQQILPEYKLQVFANFVARYLEPTVEWERTYQGVNILLPGFDATTTAYEFYIDISL